MAQTSITITLRLNRGRMNSMLQQAKGEVKRARRRDRPALLYRWGRRIANACLVPVL